MGIRGSPEWMCAVDIDKGLSGTWLQTHGKMAKPPFSNTAPKVMLRGMSKPSSGPCSCIDSVYKNVFHNSSSSSPKSFMAWRVLPTENAPIEVNLYHKTHLLVYLSTVTLPVCAVYNKHNELQFWGFSIRESRLTDPCFFSVYVLFLHFVASPSQDKSLHPCWMRPFVQSVLYRTASVVFTNN